MSQQAAVQLMNTGGIGLGHCTFGGVNGSGHGGSCAASEQ